MQTVKRSSVITIKDINLPSGLYMHQELWTSCWIARHCGLHVQEYRKYSWTEISEHQILVWSPSLLV